ncbi:hypothetical protein KFU94_12995, partial [Chloroflexi bacterium TSY]|nr:hypothetical protein [Chloroflexi bacterium TSY]
MNRLFVAVLVLLLALYPTAALAGIVFLPVGGVVYTGQGTTTVERLPSNQLLVSTTGLQGTGAIDCDGDQDCIDAGLDGVTLSLDQDMQFLIDNETLSVAGDSEGSIQGLTPDADVGFSANIAGVVTCIAAAPNPCYALHIDVQISGDLFIRLNQKNNYTRTREWRGG